MGSAMYSRMRPDGSPHALDERTGCGAGEAVRQPAADTCPSPLTGRPGRSPSRWTRSDNPADKLMPNGHGHWDGGLRPLVPLVRCARRCRRYPCAAPLISTSLMPILGTSTSRPEARPRLLFHQRLHTFTITASAFTASAKAGTGRLPFLHWFTVTDGGGVPEPFSIGLFGLHISVY